MDTAWGALYPRYRSRLLGLRGVSDTPESIKVRVVLCQMQTGYGVCIGSLDGNGLELLLSERIAREVFVHLGRVLNEIPKPRSLIRKKR